MRAFDRLPKPYRDQCELYGAHMGAFEGRPPRRKKLSPQNRRVRFAVDTDLARAKPFPNDQLSRQQQRWLARRGLLPAPS